MFSLRAPSKTCSRHPTALTHSTRCSQHPWHSAKLGTLQGQSRHPWMDLTSKAFMFLSWLRCSHMFPFLFPSIWLWFPYPPHSTNCSGRHLLKQTFKTRKFSFSMLAWFQNRHAFVSAAEEGKCCSGRCMHGWEVTKEMRAATQQTSGNSWFAPKSPARAEKQERKRHML